MPCPPPADHTNRRRFPGPWGPWCGNRRRKKRVLRLSGGAAAFFAVPNLVIALLHRRARRKAGLRPRSLPVENFAEVDDRLWRGAHPGPDGCRALAAGGVSTIVDLRAEEGVEVHHALLSELGVTRVHVPLDDGRAPTREQVDQFLRAVEASPGRVFVHCGAGVGRTGTMVAAYLVATGQSTAKDATWRNLAVGPPSVEQLAFTYLLGQGQVRRPTAAVVAFSRVVDGPRRLWNRRTIGRSA